MLLDFFAADDIEATARRTGFVQRTSKMMGKRFLASITTKKEDSTLWYLYGRMLLMVFNDALCPPMRTTLWLKQKRELSLLKFVRHFHALAARWMQAIFQSELERHRFLQRACAAAERLAA